MSEKKWNFDDDQTQTEVSVISNHMALSDETGRRKNIRFAGSLTVVISTPRGSFRTNTLNVSSGGVLLSEMVPSDFVGQVFDVLLIAERQNQNPLYIKAEGHALGAPLRSPRIAFTKAPVELQQTLRALFEDV